MALKNIGVEKNAEWVAKATRAACKYSPVVVDKKQTPQAIEYMKEVLKFRIDACKGLAATRSPWLRGSSWFSFIRGGATYDRWRPSNVPVIVLSGGSASKLQSELSKNYNLAWHPMNVRSEPIYLFVHKLEYYTYASALAPTLARYKNLYLTGWDGGRLTGFGAARAAAIGFADTLPFRPNRIVMMDQDVVLTTQLKTSKFGAGGTVEGKHSELSKPVIGLGVGYPTRLDEPMQRQFLERQMLNDTVTAPPIADFNSPAQQAVSIKAPFRTHKNSLFGDGVYPSYMVAGGEDMLMGMLVGLDNGGSPLMNGPIIKKTLAGPSDPGKNLHWAGLRVEMLEKLYKRERSTALQWRERGVANDTTIEELLQSFCKLGWLTKDEFANTSALIVERIILRLHKLGHFPRDIDQRVFNRLA